MKKRYSKPSIRILTMEMGNILAGSYHGEARSRRMSNDMFDDMDEDYDN